MRREQIIPYMFVGPALVLFLPSGSIPLIAGSVFSFADWNGIAPPRWIGLGNYHRAADGSCVPATMLNTLLGAAYPAHLGRPAASSGDLHLSGRARRAFYRAAYFFPIVLSSIMIGTMFSIIMRYDGSFNQLWAPSASSRSTGWATANTRCRGRDGGDLGSFRDERFDLPLGAHDRPRRDHRGGAVSTAPICGRSSRASSSRCCAPRSSSSR